MPTPPATVTVPLPALESCGDCARIVHDVLKDQPGVRFVAIDRARREARVEFDPSAFGEAQVASLLESIVAGAARMPPLHEVHAAHADDEAAHGHRRDAHDHGFAAIARAHRSRLVLAAALGSVVMAGQFVGGFLSGSLVLLSDAAHMFTDVASIGLAAWGVHLAMRPATREKSFGWHRSEIVAAFVNALGLWAVSAFFIVEGVRRLADPPEVRGGIVLAVGLASLAINLGIALLLHRAPGKNLNVRSAYLHVLSDVLGSLGAVGAGLAVVLFDWRFADPALTLLVTALVVAFTWRLTRQTLHILLEGTPEETDVDELRRDVLALPGVRGVHDLHVWSLTTGVHSMSAHVVVADATRGPEVAREARRLLAEKHGLGHVTLEIEPDGMPCEACP